MIDHARDYLNEKGEEFEWLESPQDRLLTLRQYGDYLERLDAQDKTDANLVPGCASATHIIARLETDGSLHFAGDSESFISRGYIYLLTEAFNGVMPDDLLKAAEPFVLEFAERAKVRMSMIQSRANAFENIFRFMQQKAVEALGQEGD